MRWLSGFGLLLVAACAQVADPLSQQGDHPLDGLIWDVAENRSLTPQELVVRLDPVDLVVLGEIHDNPKHHARQAWLISQIKPGGVAFEMVPEASEEGVAVLRAQGAPAAEIGPAIGWERLGWPDWDIYRPVFEAAGGAYIAGGGQARPDILRAIRKGAAAVYGKGAVEIGLTRGFPQAIQTALEQEMIAAHCNLLPESAAVGMVEAQRFRDAEFATAAVRAAEIGGLPAVLITGNGHARLDTGTPIYLARLLPDRSVASVAMLETREGVTRMADYRGELPYNYVWFAAPVSRSDPCEAFQ